MRGMWSVLAAMAALWAAPAAAQADWGAKASRSDAVFKDFRFGTGETLPELRIHYRTLGTPRRDAQGRITNAVVGLHGTGGSGASLLQPQFADELFGPGQPLDLSRYYIVLPDNLGHGGSSKPSDGLRMKFPRYDYADMVKAQALLLDHLKIDRVRLMFGTSMGCMHGFMWGTTNPERVRAMMPMACLPMAIAGHNRMWRKAAIEGIKADPAWNGGDYATQPVLGLRTAVSLGQVAGFAPLHLQQAYPTREAADAYIVERIERDIASRDANDFIYYFDASRNYDPSAGLERMTVPTTWINSADDFINPWDYGVAEGFGERLPDGKYVLIKATPETRGHSSHTWARLWKQEMVELLARTEE